MKKLTLLLLLGAIGYCIWYFSEHSLNLFESSTAYNEINIMPCSDVTAALAEGPYSEKRKKVIAFFDRLAYDRFGIENFADEKPVAMGNLTAKFNQMCQGEPHLPPKEVFMRLTRQEILGN